MKFTKKDVALLTELNYSEQDIRQIEEASRKTTLRYEGEKISEKQAIELLGRDCFISGLARCAFHMTAYRENKEGNGVLYNAAKYFK